jgi:hypothetical protein
MATQTRTTKALSVLALAASSLLASAVQAEQAVDDPRDVSGVRIQVDNDLFAGGGERDRDYTGGMAITISGREARDGFASLDPVLAKIDSWLIPESALGEVHHARQLGLMAFTPADIESSQPLYDDRPYASLLFVANGRVSVDADGRNAWSSNLTVGMLGLSLSGRLHSDVHKLTGSDAPLGYDNQISAGGELTARYALARHHLLVANPSGTLDVKTTVQGSIGYLTEASASISMRVGRFDSPWWGFAPELTDYIGAPLPVAQRLHGRPEVYFFTGARVKARAYNAFLQGQFRDSEVVYSASEVEPVVLEVWMGFVTQLFEQTQLSYTLNYQTAEVRDGDGERDAVWGAVQLTHSF